MNLTEQKINNYVYMVDIQEIINNPELLDEGIIDNLKDWTSTKFNSFAQAATTAAKNKDMSTLKKLGAAMPNMSLGDVNALGQKASKDFSDLKSTASKELKAKSKNKLSGNKLEAASLVFALRAIMDKNPKQQLDKSLKATDDWGEEDVGVGDVAIWIASAALGVATTIALAQLTGVLFIFGPLIFFGLWAALLSLIFGK